MKTVARKKIINKKYAVVKLYTELLNWKVGPEKTANSAYKWIPTI